MARSKDAGGSAVERLREFGLAYPGAHTKSPWPGHLDLAVNDKTFAYLSLAGEPLSISCKLPHSADSALSLPFTTPTGYGLGKSGWVTATFPDGTAVPIELLQEWIDESYRAQAPKRSIASLPPRAGGAGLEAPRLTARRGAAKIAKAATALEPAAKPARAAKPAKHAKAVKPSRARSTVKQDVASATPTARASKRLGKPASTASAPARATKRTRVSEQATRRTAKRRRAPA